MSDSEKVPYNKKADADKIRYESEGCVQAEVILFCLTGGERCFCSRKGVQSAFWSWPISFRNQKQLYQHTRSKEKR